MANGKQNSLHGQSAHTANRGRTSRAIPAARAMSATIEALEPRQLMTSITGTVIVENQYDNPGIPGVEVTYDGAGNTTTAANGSFSVVSPDGSGATHSIGVDVPAGWTQTVPAPASNGGQISNGGQNANLTFGLQFTPGFNGSSPSTSEVDLSWTNGDTALDAKIQRSSDGGVTWTTVTSSPLPSATTTYADVDAALIPGAQYLYALNMVDSGGETVASSMMAVTVSGQVPKATSSLGIAYNANPTNPLSAADPITATVADAAGLHAYDADGDALTYRLVNANGSALHNATGAATPLGPFSTGHGVVSLDTSGTYTYTPAAGFVGNDRFYFIANDGTLDSNVASVTIDVQAGMPILAGPDFSVGLNSPMTFATDYLGGHDGRNIDLSQFEIVSRPTHGTLSNSNGTLTYTPNHNYTGIDSFTYGFGADVPSTTALFDVNTSAVTWGDIDTGIDDAALGGLTYTIPRGDTLSQPYAGGLGNRVLHTEGGTLNVNILSGPSSGTLALNTNSNGVRDGSFTYTPGTTTGWVYFRYDVSSSDGSTSPPVTAAIYVSDSLPDNTYDNSDVSTPEGQTLNLDPRTAYVDSEHPLDTLTTSIVTGLGPRHGTVSANSNGTLTYHPSSGFTGIDSFTYQVSDGTTLASFGQQSHTTNLNSNFATVFVDVTAT